MRQGLVKMTSCHSCPGHHEEVPSSEASVSVTEFISSDLLPPLPHGMGSQFMFPPEGCSSGDPGAIAPPPAALVTIQPDKDYSQPPGQPVASRTQVVSVSVEGGQPQPIHSPTTPTHIRPGHVSQEDPEPQDLGVGGLSTSGISSHSSPDTPGKKERNSRKQCPYCQKGEATFLNSEDSFNSKNIIDNLDFHEMSLKRHIKDVHFKNQNTYVICPQCCKQYASQNSLYSHLNRVKSSYYLSRPVDGSLFAIFRFTASRRMTSSSSCRAASWTGARATTAQTQDRPSTSPAWTPATTRAS